MAASLFDSPMFVKSFPVGEASRLFTDSAAVRAVLLVEGTLAKVQGELGVIPEDSAFFIHRSSMEVQIDPAGLADGMKDKGFVPAIVAAFEKAMEAPEHSKFIHHNAQDAGIEAAALALRLRQFLTHCEKSMGALSLNQAKKDALKASIEKARASAVGLFMPEAQSFANALAESLRLPLFETPASSAEVAYVALDICRALAEADQGNTRLSQLSIYCDGLAKTLAVDPDKMLSFCLAQACLCAASAMEISAT